MVTLALGSLSIIFRKFRHRIESRSVKEKTKGLEENLAFSHNVWKSVCKTSKGDKRETMSDLWANAQASGLDKKTY